jgi:murein DD-endopeptidase MepM/ murein hydrolase activator NlpD
MEEIGLLRNRTAGAAAGLAVAALLAVAGSAPSGTSASGCGGSGGGSGGGGINPAESGGAGIPPRHRSHECPASAGTYVDPIRGTAWLPERTDMGVDFDVTRHKPIVAIGDAKIRGSDPNSGWPGGHFLYYKLLDGDHAGDFIYVAETMDRMLPAGSYVSAGERIATAEPGGTGTEWGWANRLGQPRAALCYREGMKTNSGAEMARFLRGLGATTADRPGPGPDFPIGPRC